LWIYDDAGAFSLHGVVIDEPTFERRVALLVVDGLDLDGGLRRTGGDDDAEQRRDEYLRFHEVPP